MLVTVVILCSAGAAALLVLSNLNSSGDGSGDMLNAYEKRLVSARRRTVEQTRRELEAGHDVNA